MTTSPAEPTPPVDGNHQPDAPAATPTPAVGKKPSAKAVAKKKTARKTASTTTVAKKAVRKKKAAPTTAATSADADADSTSVSIAKIHPDAVASIEEVLEAAREQAMVDEPMMRMFRRAIDDAGLALTAHVDRGDDGSRTVRFDSMTWEKFRRFANAINDLAEGRAGQHASVRDSSLFRPAAPSGPTHNPPANGLHIEVPA